MSSFISKHSGLITITVLFILFVIVAYLLIFSNRTSSAITKFENTFIKNNNKNQQDFCTDMYRNRNMAEFYVNSSHLPFLTGFKQYDYASYDMFMKSIQYGARYIELEIYNKEVKNDTVPVISSGNDKSQNSLDAMKCFGIIAKYAFSEKNINNYRDPFFIFLDFKTTGNYRTLDKLYEIIMSTLRHKLLDSSFNYERKNIATTDMCKLMDKVVIFSNTDYENSKIKELINMSTASSYFRRIRHDQLPLNEELVRGSDQAEVLITSTKLSFNANIITIEDDTSFIDAGIDKRLIIKIVGSNDNDTFERMLPLKQVTNKQLVFDESIEFKSESRGPSVQLKAFNKSYELKNLHNYNKNAITVVYSKYDLLVMNYNPYDAWRLGCQFVAMNYQSIDDNLKINMKKFIDLSVILKPSNLINYTPKPKKMNLNTLYPKYQDTDIPIKMDFLDNFHNIYLTPSQNDKMRVILNGNTLKLSPSYKDNNSIFEIIEGVDGTYGSISIKYGNRYLNSNDSCCYLKFSETTNNASFYPIESLCSNKKYTSFLHQKDNKKYYLKYRKEFNYKTKLYTQKTNDYKYITSLSSENGIVKIWEPINTGSYKSIGHIAIKSVEKPVTDVLLFKGAVESPIDFKLIWKDPSGITIWKPIPADGYLALGVVFNTTTAKPVRSKYVCVAIEYAEQVDLGTMAWNNRGADENNKISLWNSPDLNYVIATPSFNRPSEFDNPVYNINTADKDFADRLYLGKVGEDDLESSCFMVYEEETRAKPIERYKLTHNLSKYSEDHHIISKVGDNTCIGIKDSYWSKFYDDVTDAEDAEDTEDAAKAILVNYNGNDDEFSSNWSLFKTNGSLFTIRLRGNPKYCLTAQENTLVVKLFSAEDNAKQTFGYNGMKLFQHNEVTKEFKCVANNSGKIALEACDDTKKTQQWLINQKPQVLCIAKGKVVYLKHKSRRGKSKFTGNRPDNTRVNNYLKEFHDRDYFHYYLKGLVEDETETDWVIKLYGDLGMRNINKKTGDLILNSAPYKPLLSKGTKVLCKNGGFHDLNYREANVRWVATIIDILPDEKYNVIFTINSLEADMNKQSLGRPRENKAKILSLTDLILLKPSLGC
jgi:hypothetical protein